MKGLKTANQIKADYEAIVRTKKDELISYGKVEVVDDG